MCMAWMFFLLLFRQQSEISPKDKMSICMGKITMREREYSTETWKWKTGPWTLEELEETINKQQVSPILSPCNYSSAVRHPNKTIIPFDCVSEPSFISDSKFPPSVLNGFWPCIGLQSSWELVVPSTPAPNAMNQYNANIFSNIMHHSHQQNTFII